MSFIMLLCGVYTQENCSKLKQVTSVDSDILRKTIAPSEVFTDVWTKIVFDSNSFFLCFVSLAL